jgi:hypothetical protein
MTKYTGGETVKAGFYWQVAGWGAEIVPAAGGTLPGESGETYYRIGWPVLLVAAPVMGGAFAMFLPFIGAALLVKAGAAAVTRRFGSHRAAART